MAATLHLPLRAEVGPDAVLRPGASADPRRLDRSRVHRRAHQRLRELSRARRRRSRPSASPQRPASTQPTLLRVARMIHEGKRVSFWWTMGVNQSYEGVRTAQSLINLALMTGNIGRPGTGANSITGQCNAMGSRLFSNTTNLLGGRDFQNAEHRQKVAGFWASTRHRIPDRSQAGPTTRSSRAFCRERFEGCGSSPRTRRIRGSTRTCSATCSRGWTFSSCRTCTHTTETAAAGRPAAAGGRLGRKGRHVHQLRAAHRR